MQIIVQLNSFYLQIFHRFKILLKIKTDKTLNDLKSTSDTLNKKRPHNEFFRSLCDGFILFNYWTIVKQKNPTLIMIFISVLVLRFQSFFFLKLYAVTVISSAAFLDICYKFPRIGYPVCMFLKRHASPEFFALIGNSPFDALFAKISGPAVKAIAKPLATATGAALCIDYVASTTGLHQLAGHAVQDMYNGEKTIYKFDPELSRKPYLDVVFESFTHSKK